MYVLGDVALTAPKFPCSGRDHIETHREKLLLGCFIDFLCQTDYTNSRATCILACPCTRKAKGITLSFDNWAAPLVVVMAAFPVSTASLYGM